MSTYEPSNVEARWQERWAEVPLTNGDGDKQYVLSMYPYPSGTLHMGHVINYTIGDAVVRWHRLQGQPVLSPMGWDSFGLPAENAAIRSGIHPKLFTKRNIDEMRVQMRRCGWAYDWDAELATSHPGYYKWTQWLFLELYKAGLAVKKTAPVNWCTSCQTVLANEQVLSDGTCERDGSVVVQKDLEQWFLRMSTFAQRLLDGHASLRGKWPDRVIKMQEAWIGRSEGARIDFTIDAPGAACHGEALSVFTTRPDTTFGVTFVSLAPEHPLVSKLIAGTEIEDSVRQACFRMRNQSTTDRTAEGTEKEGVFTGRHVINPFDGSRAELWVANYALMHYGTGAVMAVPAHDHRDFAFAKKYELPIKVVIQPEEPLDAATMDDAYAGEGTMTASGEFDGQDNVSAKGAMTRWLADQGGGEATVSYKLRDWLVSRQRYWGAPIPIVYCDTCGEVPVPQDQLPVELPNDVVFLPTGDSPLATCESFVNTTCPTCGGAATRETDTLDTFVDSSWYFLRYPAARNETGAVDAEAATRWMAVDQYIGGIEHATMHLIYARFITMAMHDLGHSPVEEPFARLFCQGMVSAYAYRCPTHLWQAPEDVIKGPAVDGVPTGTCKECGEDLEVQMSKMSKTKRNGVSPDRLLTQSGADATRLAILFMGPPDKSLEYNESTVRATRRYLQRVHDVVQERAETLRAASRYAGDGSDLDQPLRQLRHKTYEVVQRITSAFDNRGYPFNTCVSGLMEVGGGLRDAGAPADALAASVQREVAEVLIVLLAPFAPHLAEELWSVLGHEALLFSGQPVWPAVDERALQQDTVEIVVQVNGKVRARLQMPADIDADALAEAAQAEPELQRWLSTGTLRKVISLPKKRLVNLVVR